MDQAPLLLSGPILVLSLFLHSASEIPRDGWTNQNSLFQSGLFPTAVVHYWLKSVLTTLTSISGFVYLFILPKAEVW